MTVKLTKNTESHGFTGTFAEHPSPGITGKQEALAEQAVQSTWKIQKLRAAKVKQADLILFTSQLSVMLDSGVVLSDALDAISEQTEYGIFKTVIVNVSEIVKGGEPFSRALSACPKVFNSMFISMVRASEASGKMAEMLNILSGYLEFEEQTRKRVKGALTYPFIMGLAAIAASGTLMFFVLPKFTKIYAAKGTELPKITQLLVGLSNMISDLQTMTLFVTVVTLAFIGLYYWVKTVSGRRTIDFIKIHTPVLGSMFVDMVVTRSMCIMATMINTGVSLLDAIDVIQGSCDNYHFQKLWQEADKKIRDGYQLSESIRLSPDSHLIAPGIIQMLKAGEKSGSLGKVCNKISIFYGKQLEASINTVTSFIEPVMILVLGSIIGTVAIALLLPVFKISSVITR